MQLLRRHWLARAGFEEGPMTCQLLGVIGYETRIAEGP
jgi:hypothetical protein